MSRWHGLSRAERRELLIPMLKRKMTYGEISAACSTTRHCIAGFVFRNLQDVKDRPRKRIRYEWTAEKLARVYELARAGHSPRQIAAMMPPRRPSEHSVYEKLRPLRKELKAARQQARPAPDEKAAARKKAQADERRAVAMIRFVPPKTAAMPKLREIPVAAPKPLLERRMSFECAWIVGEAKVSDPQCCGAPTAFGTNWCQAHREIVFA